MSGRGRQGRGRGGRGYRNRRNNNTNSGSNTNTNRRNANQPKQRKVLSDYIYYVGSARQASDFNVITEYLINYIRMKFSYGGDITKALEDQNFNFDSIKPKLSISTETDKAAKEAETREFELEYGTEIKEFIRRKSTYEANKEKAAAFIWSQCNKNLQHKLQSKANYESDIKNKPIALLNAIEEFSISYQENKFPQAIVVDSFKNFFNLKQKEDESLHDYTRRFKSARDIWQIERPQ